MFVVQADYSPISVFIDLVVFIVFFWVLFQICVHLKHIRKHVTYWSQVQHVIQPNPTANLAAPAPAKTYWGRVPQKP